MKSEQYTRSDDPEVIENWRERAESLYHDQSYMPRPCDHCGKPYTGPAVYCSLKCAIADA